ncbi:MAG: tetratricopeptide repeat protein [Propionivibrio sp.]
MSKLGLKRQLRRCSLLAFLLLPFLAGTTLAAGGGGSSSSSARTIPADPDYEAAVAAIKKEDFPLAIQKLEIYTARMPNDADAWNWLGYANRKSGNVDLAFDDYDKALRIDPDHRGAHEYVGEAYLMVGNLAKAEEHLRVLDKLCLFPCEEFSDLKQAVADYKARNGVQ